MNLFYNIFCGFNFSRRFLPLLVLLFTFQSNFSQETVYGCMDPVSSNYNSMATVDDGSCEPASYTFNSKEELQTAVDLWVSDQPEATTAYGEINTWDVSPITDMSNLFYDKQLFNADISNWDVSNVTTMNSMFRQAYAFNQDIGAWDVSSVTDMDLLFRRAYIFNQDLSDWDVSSVTTMSAIFTESSFANGAENGQTHPSLNSWNVSSVINMARLFWRSPYNGDISQWETSGVTDMNNMFAQCSFNNSSISEWDVSSVTDMSYMFQYHNSFNQDISGWDVSNVNNMAGMFLKAPVFNKDISSWNVGSVTNMQQMFTDACAFNQAIGTWDVSNVTNMISMFANFANCTTFNQDLGSWNISSVTDMSNMFTEVTLSQSNYDSTLNSWATQSVQSDVNFDGGDSVSCHYSGRNALINEYNWVITDGGTTGGCVTLEVSDTLEEDNSVTFSFNIENFTVGQDGYIQYSINDDISIVAND
jgi:surface protein